MVISTLEVSGKGYTIAISKLLAWQNKVLQVLYMANDATKRDRPMRRELQRTLQGTTAVSQDKFRKGTSVCKYPGGLGFLGRSLWRWDLPPSSLPFRRRTWRREEDHSPARLLLGFFRTLRPTVVFIHGSSQAQCAGLGASNEPQMLSFCTTATS